MQTEIWLILEHSLVISYNNCAVLDVSIYFNVGNFLCW